MERAAATVRAREELGRLSRVADQPDDKPAEPQQCDHFSIRRVADQPDDRPAEPQQCDHFSIRGYVALLQKKDPKRYSLPQVFREQQPQDEQHSNLCPLSVAKFRRWNCSNCLDKMKNSDHRTASRTVSTKQDGTNDGCSISFVRTLMPTSVDSRRLPPCTQQSPVSTKQDGTNAGCTISVVRKPTSVDSGRLLPCTEQSSQGNNAAGTTFLKSAQECNSKCNSPSGSTEVPTEVNVDPAIKELQGSPNNLDVMADISIDVPVDGTDLPEVPQMISSKAGHGTKDLQGSPNNLHVMANISSDVPADVTDLPDVPQMILSQAGNGTKDLQGALDNLDVMANISNDASMDVIDLPAVPQIPSKPCEMPNEDENERTQAVQKGDCSAPNVPKPISGHKGSQVRNRGPRQAASNRYAGLFQKKPKKTRLISELIETDQVGGSAKSIEVGHSSIADVCESDKGKMSSEVGKDNGTPVSKEKVEEIQSRTSKNKKKLRVDNADDASSLMNWLKKTHKKVRTEKKDSGHKNVDSSSVIANSNPVIPASKAMHHNSLPSVGDVNQKNVISAISAKQGNENMQNYNLEQNMEKADDLCQNEPRNSKQKALSKGKSAILLKRKRKVPPTTNAQQGGENTDNSTVQTCLTKVSLGKRGIHNVSGLRDQKMPKNKKKRKLEMHDKHTLVDDIPMDIVELLARNQRERLMMTDTDSLENSHSRPKKSAEDCAQIASRDCSVDAPTKVLDTNFQGSLASERTQKSFKGHASSSTEAANVHPLEELHTQKSLQGHAASSTEAVNVNPPKLHIPDLVQCTQEQQAHLRMDEEVTIACVSPTLSHHQYIAEVPAQSWSNKGTKKLMWDSFKTASRDSQMSAYGAEFSPGIREVDPALTRVYGASSNYPTHPPVTAAVDHYTDKAVNQVQLRSFPSTISTMEAGRLYDQRITGQSDLYPRETMPATHLLRLMGSSTASGLVNYEMPNRNLMEFQAYGSQYGHNQHKASPSTSRGGHLVPLTLEDLSRHQVQKNLHRPLRPRPRVGVLGSLLQRDIANWSENCGTQSGQRIGVAKGKTSFDRVRKENFEALNSGMFSARWNALQFGFVGCVTNPEYSSPRHGEAQSWTRGTGKTVHPLDKLVKKDICQTNRNPADFTTVSDNNEYMFNL